MVGEPEPVLTVDLEAVAANTRTLRARCRGRLMAVVKADGFGHGAAEVARTALEHGASCLGVTSIGEALQLRRAGIEAPVLSWLNPVGADFGDALTNDVEVAVPSPAHLTAVADAARRSCRTARLHLQLDVGMSRDGAPPEAWAELCALARRAERAGLTRVVGVMGHLGWADRPADPLNARGRDRFVRAVDQARAAGLRPAVRHLAATAATLTDPAGHFDLCRVGAGLVGIDPSGTTRLRGAMTMTAPVVSVRDVPAGAHVGYGRSYRTTAATRLALVPVGYADGVPRAAEGRAEVLVAGRRRPVVGGINMDQFVVDVGTARVDPGDPVTVLGPGAWGEPTVADWARWGGTIEHEIVTGIGARIRRRVVAASASAERVPA